MLSNFKAPRTAATNLGFASRAKTPNLGLIFRLSPRDLGDAFRPRAIPAPGDFYFWWRRDGTNRTRRSHAGSWRPCGSAESAGPKPSTLELACDICARRNQWGAGGLELDDDVYKRIKKIRERCTLANVHHWDHAPPSARSGPEFVRLQRLLAAAVRLPVEADLSADEPASRWPGAVRLLLIGGCSFGLWSLIHLALQAI